MIIEVLYEELQVGYACSIQERVRKRMQELKEFSSRRQPPNILNQGLRRPFSKRCVDYLLGKQQHM